MGVVIGLICVNLTLLLVLICRMWKKHSREMSDLERRLAELEAWKRLLEKEAKKIRNSPTFDIAKSYEQVQEQLNR